MALVKNKNAFAANFFLKLSENKKVIVASSLFCLLGIPLFVLSKVMNTYKNSIRPEDDWYYNSNYYSGYFSISIISMTIMLLVVIISAFVVFKYLYNKPMVDVIYSLPVTSAQRFLSDYLAGLTSFALPYTISVIISLIINAVAFYAVPEWASHDFQGETGSTAIILKACIGVFLIMLMLYTITVFILICCGSIVESIGYSVMIHVMIPLIWVALQVFMSDRVYGNTLFSTMSTMVYTTVVGGLGQIYNLMTDIIGSSTLKDIDIYNFGMWVIYFIVSAVIFGFAYMLYRKRKAEDVSKPFVFGLFYYIFMTGICFCMSAGMVWYATESWLTKDTEEIGTVLAWVILSLIIFFVLDTIRNRGFSKILTGFVRYFAMTGFSVLFFIILIQTGGFGNVLYIPEIDEIASVDFSSYYAVFSKNSRSTEFINKSEIETVWNTHNKIIDKYKEFLETKPGIKEKVCYQMENAMYPFRITYMLKSGKTVSKSYYENPEMFMDMSRLYLSDSNIERIITEMKKEALSYYNYSSSAKISITDRFGNDFGKYMSRENYDSLIEAYEKDLRNADIDDIMNEAETYCYLVDNAVLTSYKNTIAYLTKLGIEITDEASAEVFKSYNYDETTTRLTMTMNASLVMESTNLDVIEPKTSINPDYTIRLRNNTKRKFVDMIIKCEPCYITSDTDAVIIGYQGNKYILPSEYRHLAEEFLSSLSPSSYYDKLDEDYPYEATYSRY